MASHPPRVGGSASALRPYNVQCPRRCACSSAPWQPILPSPFSTAGKAVIVAKKEPGPPVNNAKPTKETIAHLDDWLQFVPTSPNFGSSAEQSVDTAGVVINQSVGALLGLFGGPAHTQMLSYGAAQDQLREASHPQPTLKLSNVRDKIRAGTCDHTELLDRLEAGISKTTFMERGANNIAASVVSDIRQRKTIVKMRYLREVGKDPSLKEVFKAYDPAGCRW